jgi:hypothetical protein
MMGAAAKQESDFDSLAVAAQLDPLDAAATVLPSELLGRDTCAFHNAGIGDQLSCGCAPHHVEVRDRLRRRLDSGLARTLCPRTQNNALLRCTKTDHGSRRDHQCKYGGHRRLAAFVA